jgi:hypothetical protein
VPDDELLEAPHLGASIPEVSTEEQDTDIYPEPGTFTDVPLNMDMLLGKVNQTNKDPVPTSPPRRLETVDEIVNKLRKKEPE